MGNFIIPDWGMPQSAPPPPPPDPRVAREEKIANDTRVESELNRFIASKQDALFDNPDAFYRTEGEDAIHAAPVATKTLEQLRDDLLDGLANDYQRRRLGAALDAQMQLTRQQMARHVAEQSLAWQRRVAQDRIDILAREAALHHNDDVLIDGIGSGAANAARAHARVGGGPIDAERENAAAATARSRIVSSAIQARLDKGHTEGAAALFERVRDQLDPAHAAPLQRQIDTVQRLDAAKDYARQLVPVWSDTSHEEVDAQHASATQQNQTDNAGDPEYRADVQHVLDVQHGLQKRGLDQKLQLNDEASNPTPSGQFVLLPVPGSAVIEPGPQPPSDQQPPDQSPNPPPSEPEQRQPDPAPDEPVDTDPPVLPAREEDPENSTEASERAPGSAVIGKAAAGLIASPQFGVPTGPTTGPLAAAVERLATAVAARVPTGVGIAIAAPAAAAGVMLTPMNSQGGTIELGDGLRAQWVPGQRSATIERRASKGLFGSSVGESWERVPVDATYEAGPDGRPTLFVNPQALKAAIATPHFQALPASKPSIFEIRIGVLANGGATTRFREATHEEISRVCRAYPVVQDIGLRASMTVRATGLANGLEYGRQVHNLAEQDVLKISESEAMLKKIGIRELLPEIALQAGAEFSYRRKGSSVLDVMEIPPKRGTVCVYDFKTGNATFPDDTMIRYAREAAAYVENLKMGYTRIYVIPIFVP